MTNKVKLKCIVPCCKSISPIKSFARIPSDLILRKLWLEAAHLNRHAFPSHLNLYMCEDHFDMDVDMEPNYSKYKPKNGLKRIKHDIIPHRFDCMHDSLVFYQLEEHGDIESTCIFSQTVETKEPFQERNIASSLPEMTNDQFIRDATLMGKLPKLDVKTLFNFIKSPMFKNDEGVEKYDRMNSDLSTNVKCLEIKRLNNDVCTVRAEINSEFNNTNCKNEVIMKIDEEMEKIIGTVCTCRDNSESGCIHTFILLLWIHGKHSGEEKQPFKENYTSYCGDDKFVKEYESAVVEREPLKPTVTDRNNDKTNLTEFVNECNNDNLVSNFTELNSVSKLSLHNLLFEYKSILNNNITFDEFCKERMNLILCSVAEIRTVNRKQNPLWYELKYGRINDTKLFDFANYTTTSNGRYNSILIKNMSNDNGKKKNPNTVFEIIKALEIKNNLRIIPCGVFLRSEFPLFSATCDGITDEHIVEIKYISSNQQDQSDFNDYVNNGLLKSKYMAQVQLQMHMANKSKALFCIVTDGFENTKIHYIFEINYNTDILFRLMQRALAFWNYTIFKNLKESYSAV